MMPKRVTAPVHGGSYLLTQQSLSRVSISLRHGLDATFGKETLPELWMYQGEADISQVSLLRVIKEGKTQVTLAIPKCV